MTIQSGVATAPVVRQWPSSFQLKEIDMDLELLITLTCIAVVVWIITMIGGIAVSMYTLWKS